MQQLKNFTVQLKINNEERNFEVNEKDMDDSICYDIYLDGIFLLSISPTGEIMYKAETNILDDITTGKLIKEIKKSI